MSITTVQKVRLKQALLAEAVEMLGASIATLNGLSLAELRRGQATLLAKVVIDLEGVKHRLDNVLAQ